MKLLLFIFFAFTCNTSFAELYFRTEYQEGKKPKVITEQHMFLDKRYPVNYTKKGYVFILKKVTATEATIESESYDINKIGHKTMVGGSYGTYRVGNSFTLSDESKGIKRFTLKIYLEKIVLPKN